MHRTPRPTTLAFATLAALALASRPARALQPLEEFTRAARTGNLERRDAALVVAQRGHEADSALGRLLPSVSATASYTRNQVEVSVSRPGPGGQIESAIISPLDQLDASVALRVPLVDVGGWRRLAAARSAEEAARLRTGAAEADTDAEIARHYYALVGARWLAAANEKALEAATKNHEVIALRRQAERALDTDVLRARAEVERTRRAVAEAHRQERSAARNLRFATGLEPTDGVLPEVAVPTAAPAPASLEPLALATPAVHAADADTAAADATAAAAKAALLPILTATATERITNATGFASRNALFALQLTASWAFDYTTVTQARAAEAGAALAKSRAERTRRMQVDVANEAADRIASESARLVAASAEEQAAEGVAAALRARLAAGTATVNDVVLAERDVLAASAGRIQAAAELAYARALLETRIRGVGP